MHQPSPTPTRPFWLPLAGIAALVTGCTSTPRAPTITEVIEQPPIATPQESTRAPEAEPAPPPYTAPPPTLPSEARTLHGLKKEIASHLYRHNKDRIYKGKLPPLLHAIGVLQLQIDTSGQIQYLNWLRAPSHAPEVVAEIERTVKAAQPYPAPVHLGPVVMTETWLWHKSGKFQLDTLTEGQK